MELKRVGMEEFTKVIYPEYLKIFSKEERKPYKTIEKAVLNNIASIFEIIEKDKLVGFIIIEGLENAKYAILDYFAILPEYQNKGYGTSAIKLLKEQDNIYDGIFIEVEKCGLGQDEEENKTRERRAKFYENIGFHKLGFDIELYKVIYSTYMLQTADKEILEKEVIEDIFKIYIAISGEKRVKSNFKVIKI